MNLEVLGELDVELCQFTVGDNSVSLFIQVGNEYLLSCCIEGKLFLYQLIWTLIEYILDFLVIIEFYCHS